MILFVAVASPHSIVRLTAAAETLLAHSRISSYVPAVVPATAVWIRVHGVAVAAIIIGFPSVLPDNFLLFACDDIIVYIKSKRIFELLENY